MTPERRFVLFVQHRMYNDLVRLWGFVHGAYHNEWAMERILKAIPLRLYTLRGTFAKKMVRFLDYKMDLLERYRNGEDIEPHIINAGFRTPILRSYWIMHTSMDVRVDRNGTRTVETLEDRLSKVLCI